MVRLGISGHRSLSRPTVRMVEERLRAVIASYAIDDADGASGVVVGVSCLADGADQLFARAVLETNGTLEVIVPAANFRARLPKESQTGYDELLAAATDIHELPFPDATDDALLSASWRLLERIEVLVAVWDGEPARGRGGTGDVVRLAKALGVAVIVVWPDGSERN